jgi:hypothetical protein
MRVDEFEWGFMKPQIIADKWFTAENEWGDSESVPAEYEHELRDAGFTLEGGHSFGYGARLSAPGYMDCTDWVVFDTFEEADEYLAEMYGVIDD